MRFSLKESYSSELYVCGLRTISLLQDQLKPTKSTIVPSYFDHTQHCLDWKGEALRYLDPRIVAAVAAMVGGLTHAFRECVFSNGRKVDGSHVFLLRALRAVPEHPCWSLLSIGWTGLLLPRVMQYAPMRSPAC
jgi:hypothetical protein